MSDNQNRPQQEASEIPRLPRPPGQRRREGLLDRIGVAWAHKDGNGVDVQLDGSCPSTAASPAESRNPRRTRNQPAGLRPRPHQKGIRPCRLPARPKFISRSDRSLSRPTPCRTLLPHGFRTACAATRRAIGGTSSPTMLARTSGHWRTVGESFRPTGLATGGSGSSPTPTGPLPRSFFPKITDSIQALDISSTSNERKQP